MSQPCEDLEDGEIADSGEDEKEDANGAVAFHPGKWQGQSIDPAAHRGTRISGITSSEEESYSEEEHDTSPCKMKRVRGMTGQSFPTFQNPLLAAKSGSDKSRRQNNIWGSVLTEQTLTTVVSAVGVEEKVVDCDRDVESYDYTKAYDDKRVALGSPVRGLAVESESEQDDLEQIESFGAAPNPKRRLSIKARLGSRCSVSSGDDSDASEQSEGSKRTKEAKARRGGGRRHENRKRRRSLSKEQKKQGLIMKDRLGTRSYDHNKDRSHISATFEDGSEVLVEELMRVLGEPEHQRQLLMDLARVMGTRRMLEILYITEDLEQTGGLMTMDGRRRRTTGGVYLTLAKEDTSVDQEAVLGVFREHQKDNWKKVKAERKNHKKNRKPQKKPDATEQMETSLPAAVAAAAPTGDHAGVCGAADGAPSGRQLMIADDDLFDCAPDIEIDVF